MTAFIVRRQFLTLSGVVTNEFHGPMTNADATALASVFLSASYQPQDHYCDVYPLTPPPGETPVLTSLYFPQSGEAS